MSWSQNHEMFTPGQKKVMQFQKFEDNQQEQTILKNVGRNNFPAGMDQNKTPIQGYQPKKGLIFLGSNRSKHIFPLYRDEEIGIVG